MDAASSVKETLQAAGIKVKIDDSEQRTPGWKFNFWEMKVCSCHPLISWLSLQIKHNLATCFKNFSRCVVLIMFNVSIKPRALPGSVVKFVAYYRVQLYMGLCWYFLTILF